ncbi:MAG TPA: MFS transporter [Chloroflexota bacterium]|nr:MFS transporter [Chloroflexota bacterium]
MQLSWRGVNVLLLTTSTVMFATEGHLIAFTPLQLRELGLDEAEVGVWTGILVAVTMSMALPLGPFWGVLAERFSRRAILLRTYVVLAIALLLAAWAEDLAWMVVARAMLGFSYGVGGVITATQAMVTPPRHVGRAVATVQTAMPIAASLGPPLGALAIPLIGLRGLLVVDAVLSLAAGVVVWLLLPEPKDAHKPTSVMGRMGEVLQMAWSTPPVRWNLANQFLVRAGAGTVESYISVRIVQVASDPASAIGWILGGYGVVTTLSTWWVGRLADGPDIVRIYTLGMLSGAVIALGIAFSPWLWVIAIFAILRGISTALARPLLLAHLARVVPRDHQTGVFGLFPTVGNVGGLIFPLIAAGVVGSGLWTAFAIGSLGYAASVVTGVKLGRVRSAPRDEPVLG